MRYLLLGLLLFPSVALAGGRELATKDFRELEALAGASVGSSDYVPVYDASADKVKKVPANSISPAPTAFDSSSVAFSTAQTGNPLLQMTSKHLVVSTDLTSTATTTILASAAGKTLYFGQPTIMVSGTAAGATAIALECSDGTLVASWPIADLVSLVPMGVAIHVSTQSAITKGAGLINCPASTALVLSNVGANITTTTDIYVNVPYTVRTGAVQ